MLLLDGSGIALAAGMQFGRETAPAEPEQHDTEPTIPALMFRDLDGVRRAVALAAVDRVEPVSTDDIHFTAGELRLSIDGRIIPLAAQGSFDGRREIAVLRLTDGSTEIGYAIAEALDIADLPLSLVRAREPGPVAGVVSVNGDQVEMLDPHWLFAQHGDGSRGEAAAPLCLLTGREAGWMATFLRPTLERAGYRVATGLKPGETPALMLAMDDDPQPQAPPAPVLRLRRQRRSDEDGDGTIFRYDRAGMMDALASHAAAIGGR
jgi:two-component system chemotaxis sensor kinase CheA